MGERPDTRTLVVITGALLLWASAFAGIRAGLVAYGPGELALLRFGTASLALAAYALSVRMRLPALRDLPRLALAGLLGITIYHVALNFGEQTVSAGAAALLISASPVFTALMSAYAFKERLTAWGWFGILVSFAGVALISFGEGGHLQFEPGALLVLLSAFTTSAYFILSKPMLRRYSSLEYTSYAIWAGTIPMLVFAPGLVEQISVAPASATLAGVYIGLFPGAIAYVLWSTALSRMPASLLSTFLYFQPVNATVIAWLWLGEIPGWLSLVGGSIALAGVIVVNLKGTRGVGAAPVEDPLIITVESPEHVEAARELFREYHGWLGDVVCSRTMTQETESLPAPYTAPGGRLLLAFDSEGTPAGCVGVRPFEGSVCEIKRLYVRPAARGAGVGSALMKRALSASEALGYTEARMTTLPDSMRSAFEMYLRMGFSEVEPFYDHSHVDPSTKMAFLSRTIG